MKIREKPEDARRAAKELLEQAARAKADIACLPELFAHMWDISKSRELTESQSGPITSMMREIARKHKMAIVGGSLFVKKSKSKPLNTMCVINKQGRIIARYSKLHLFELNRPGEIVYNESDFMAAGKQPTITNLEGNLVGLAICNDLRFPELFRSYAMKGAIATVAPSAFTSMTGQHHWHLLTRTRAAESKMYVLAPNCCGANRKGIQFFGHSIIVGPWGEVLAEAPGDSDAVIFADIDPSYVAKLRRELPTLSKIRKSYKVKIAK